MCKMSLDILNAEEVDILQIGDNESRGGDFLYRRGTKPRFLCTMVAWLANGDSIGARGMKDDRWSCRGKRGEDLNEQK